MTVRKTLIRVLGVVIFLLLIVSSINKAAQFSVNPYRFDPYKQFKFRVKWDGRYIPGIIRVSGLHRNTKVVRMRNGNEPGIDRKSPGQTDYEPITLERGRTHDAEFEKWANKIMNYGSGAGKQVSLKDFRKDIIIELANEAGQTVMAFKVYRCWPSRYNALEALDANSPDVAIESIVLENEGWERDYDVTEPQEPSFTEPQ